MESPTNTGSLNRHKQLTVESPTKTGTINRQKQSRVEYPTNIGTINSHKQLTVESPYMYYSHRLLCQQICSTWTQYNKTLFTGVSMDN